MAEQEKAAGKLYLCATPIGNLGTQYLKGSRSDCGRGHETQHKAAEPFRDQDPDDKLS